MSSITPDSFATFGDLLRHLRRSARLTQRELGIAVGYSEAQIGRLENNERTPDPAVIRARFVEALNLENEPETAARLIALAIAARGKAPPHDETASASKAASHPKRTNLPAPLTSFIGREQEIADLAERAKTTRLLTLTGSGGVGKSRLALEVAGRLLGAFADGVWLVELAPLSDPALLPQTLANVFKLPEQPGRTHLDLLVGYLESKQVLLVLDNCEHLIEACAALVQALLQRCPELHVLATSREKLRVPGEVTHHVPSLTTPEGAMPPDDMLRYEAVRLFRERAITSQSMFEWSVSDAAAVASICTRLDGIPLAIELATARLNVFTAEQIAERLMDRFSLLVTGSRTALPRHQTLRAAIDWSYDLLTEREQQLLNRLSVFAAGFTAEAAEFVSRQPEALTLLSNLVDKSLVIAEVKGKTMRYRLLETIRQYARDRSLERSDVEEARDQHLRYFLQLAEQAEPELRRTDQIIWLDRLETELDNIRAALAWSLESERHVEAGLRLASALLWLWHIHSRWREGSHWLERELSAEVCTPGAKPHSEARSLARAQALNAAVFLIDNYAKRVALAEEALALSRKLGDAGKRSMAFALWNLADLAHEQQDYSRARVLLEESLALYREAGDQFGMAQCFNPNKPWPWQRRQEMSIASPHRTMNLERRRGVKAIMGR
jgi:non-specific serine/threonine protein kinase